MKLDRTLLFQGLLSLALVAFAALFAISLLTSLRPPPQTVEPPEASRDLIVADRAEWRQFYDAVVGSERAPQVAQPADAAPEKPAAGGVVEVPAATAGPEDQAPGVSVSATAATALPIAPDPVAREPAVNADAPPVQVAAPPDPPPEERRQTAVSNEPSRDQGPRETVPSVSAPETSSPALATAPVPDAATGKTAESTTPPVAQPVPMPRPRVAAPAQPVPGAAPVRQAAPEPEREPERSRPSTPARPRVALPRQRPAPRPDGPQRIDPQQFAPQQQQPGTMSYAPQQNNAMPPGGPQFGPYFPYGSTPPSARRSRTQQPGQTYNDPFGWR